MFPTYLWWLIGVRGVLAILFGVAAICWPVSAVAVLVMLCGAYLAIDGVIILGGHLFSGTSHATSVAQGIVYVLFGVAALVWPEAATRTLLIFAGALAIAAGTVEIIHGIKWRRSGQSHDWSFVNGIVAIGFGILMFAAPLLGAVAIGLLLGVYALAYGFALLITAQTLRNSFRRGKSFAVPSLVPPEVRSERKSLEVSR